MLTQELLADTPTASPAAPTPLSLEARLAAADAAMTVRLETALLALAVDSAYAEEPDDLVDVVTVPIAMPTVTDPTYTTPIAGLLQRAHHRLTADGWCRGQLVDEAGQRCLLGAIRAESHGDRGMEATAAAVVLDAIREEFEQIETVPQFNDHLATPASALRVLGAAADLATTRLM